MRDLLFVAFLAAFGLLGIRRPFLFVIAYVYIDIVSPQRLSYYLLNALPISAIFFALALGGWLLTDDKSAIRLTVRQLLLLLLLAWAGYTTAHADFPIDAEGKWQWVWKSLVFAAFLPFTLRTRLRIESILLFMVLAASSIIVVGGIKTLGSGGGYGSLNLMVDNNSGLYEGSTISTVAIAIIPLILFFTRYGTIFKPDWRVKLYCYALIIACLLIPVGTEARTGLICIALLALLTLRTVKKRMRYMLIVASLALVSIPFLPASFSNRMDTIAGYKGDTSASTRVAVWKWTIDYVKENPLGGGFNCFLQNKLDIQITGSEGPGLIVQRTEHDRARAFHNSYFEMLGEQGIPGLLMFLMLHLIGLVRMEVVRRAYAQEQGDNDWVTPLATALQHGHLIYLVGAFFVGIAFQPFIYMLVAVEIGFDRYVQRFVARPKWDPFVAKKRPAPAS